LWYLTDSLSVINLALFLSVIRAWLLQTLNVSGKGGLFETLGDSLKLKSCVGY